jgi:hypothetical protein
MAKRTWSELSTPAKVGVVTLAAVEAVITTIAARDAMKERGLRSSWDSAVG